MTSTTQSAAFVIESEIDSSTLAETQRLIAEVCREKAQHLRETWQDFDTARVWDRAAARAERTAEFYEQLGL